MKKLFTTSLVMLAASAAVSAYADDQFICGFEEGETGYAIQQGWAQGYEWGATDNPDASGINPSDRVMKCEAQVAPDSWGGWFTIFLDEPITVTAENRYLKIMMRRNPNQNSVSLALRNGDVGGERDYLGRAKPAKADVWEDLVFDLFNDNGQFSWENKQFDKIYISHFGTWDGTDAGVCFMDNIVLSDNSKPRGAHELEAGLLADFDNADLTAANFSAFLVQSPEAKFELVDNPVVSEVNSSAKCMEYTKPANTVWWHSALCQINGIVNVEYPNCYLHAMVYVPDETAFTMIAASNTGKEVIETMYPEDGEGWYDYVMDISELGYLRGVNFRFNYESDEDWENPEGKYYIDEIEVNGSDEPRESAGINEIVANGTLNVYTANGKLYVSANEGNVVEVYSSLGQLVGKKTVSNATVSFDLNNGFYVVKATGANGKATVAKAIVK